MAVAGALHLPGWSNAWLKGQPAPFLCSGSTRALLPPWAPRHLQPDTHCPSDSSNNSTWDNMLRALTLLKRERLRWAQGQGPNVFAQHHCTTQCICGVSVLILQDKTTFNSFNGIILLPGFVLAILFFLKDQTFKFCFFARAETSKIFFH